jgi:hypothetical protein
MATIYHSARLSVPADVAWDFLEKYTRGEVHAFSACVAERQEGDYRVVTLADGTDVPERNVTVDAVLMRAVYTVPGLLGCQHHQAEMRVLEDTNGSATLEWITDILPAELATSLTGAYNPMFLELVDAINHHPGTAP